MIRCPRPYRGQVFTVIVTNDCNLRCRYCYETDKCSRGTVSLTDVDAFAKMLISGGFDIGMDSYEIDLLGGDALMHPDLCGKIIDTFLRRMVLDGFEGRNSVKFSICSNGTLFGRKDVRDFLLRYRPLLSLGVSIDGSPRLHDLNRIHKDERGSMKEILEWWPWFRDNFPEDSLFTKATLSRESIPYMAESLSFMHEELGLKYIHQNFIMEDSHLTPDDLKLFRAQMESCSAYVYEHRDDLYWSMLDRVYTKRKMPGEGVPDIPRCGSGVMPTMDIDGKLYACPRWCPFAIGKNTISIGDVRTGDYFPEKAKFITDGSKRSAITWHERCRNCEYEEQCAFCPAGCYGEYGELKRTMHICLITRIQAEAAASYWRRINDEDTGTDR